MRSAILRAAAAACAVAAVAAPLSAQEFEWPRLLVIGTPGTASGSFASTNGWAPVLQADTGVTVRVVPEDSEPQRFRRLTDSRNIAVTSVSAAEMRFQVQGIDGYASLKPEAMRIIWHHNDTPWALVVSGNSEFETMQDLQDGNARLARGMFSPAMIVNVEKAIPAFMGLSPETAQETFEYVPLSSYVANCRSVVEGQSDAAWCASISSVLAEMEGAPGGIRWIPMPPDDAAAWEGFLEHSPMSVPATIEIGVESAHGVPGITSNFVYSVTADADEELVYNMAKWMHTAYDRYSDKHPLAARMSLDQFRKYLDRSPMPVHAGTVRYLREIGAWTDEDDVWNDAAAAKMDAWIEARRKGMAAAAAEGVDIDFRDEKFREIMDEHTAGLEGFRSRL